ncbi:MAG: hypothetical protein ACF8LK_08690 [Phycisphaerales bacterium JB041]
MTTFACTTENHAAIAEARSRAERTLAQLRTARDESERRLSESGQPDHLKRVTGKSALENAIAAAQHVIDALDRQAAIESSRPSRAESPEVRVVTIDGSSAVSRQNRFARVS